MRREHGRLTRLVAHHRACTVTTAFRGANLPYPINEFIVKVASRCNLDCDYCYEYHAGDETWRSMPKFMSAQTCEYLASRVAEHAVRHQLSEVFVTFHGGEPTLAGPKRLDEYCGIFLAASAGRFGIVFAMQTNATRVTEDLCAFLKRRNVTVSVSIDGGKSTNDRHRLDHRGKSSYDQARRGIEKLKSDLGPQLSGILAVVDIESNPLQVFDELASFGLPSVEFLLPHHTWDKPPPRPNGSPVAYGEWYLEVFQAWVHGRHGHIDIRFFMNILRQMTGRTGLYEAMNLAPATLLTVNTDGGYEAVDCIKSTGSGAQKLGISVREGDLDGLLRHPSIAVRQSGEEQLSAQCRACKYKTTCAGGYYPHRFSMRNGFDNESVYCADLYWLLERIESHTKSMRVQHAESAV